MNRGQLTLVARLHAEKKSRSEESQALSATHEALAEAHDSIVQLVLERDSERAMRLDAEANVRTVRRGRDAAMDALQHALQVLRNLKGESAERQRQADKLKTLVEAERRVRKCAEKRARADRHAHEQALHELRGIRRAAAEQTATFVRLEARCETMEAQLEEVESALADAEAIARRQSVKQAELKTQLEQERRARLALQSEIGARQIPREDAAHPLGDIGSSRVWKKLRLAHR